MESNSKGMGRTIRRERVATTNATMVDFNDGMGVTNAHDMRGTVLLQVGFHTVDTKVFHQFDIWELTPWEDAGEGLLVIATKYFDVFAGMVLLIVVSNEIVECSDETNLWASIVFVSAMTDGGGVFNDGNRDDGLNVGR